MELVIDSEILASAVVNVDKFEKIMRKEFDLLKAFDGSVNLQSNNFKKESDADVLRTMYIHTDWGQILRLYNSNKQPTMHLYIQKMDIQDMPILFPKKSIQKMHKQKVTKRYTFRETRFNGQEYIVSNTFIPLAAYHVERFLGMNVFDYSESNFDKQYQM